MIKRMCAVVMAFALLNVGCGDKRVLNPSPVTIDPVSIEGKIPLARNELIFPLLLQIKEQERELLPFDEPKREFGLQLDGSLRPAWEQAYRRGQSSYTFNGDKYVTMYEGRPFVPQVCADFIVDTIDRTAGTWYLPTLKDPGKTMGRHDIRMLMSTVKLDPRRLNELVQYFKQNPQSYQIIFEGNGPKLSETKRARTWMKQLQVQAGDIVIIRGKVPWDNGREEHNHSMFVTGLNENGEVQLVTGNPVWPIERSLAIEGNRTPKRRIVYIVRLTDEFLRRITGLDDD